jgi:type IV secretory pathway TrbF-like protein
MSTNFNRETPSYKTPAAETPYLRAKQQWDQRLAVFALASDLWRKIAMGSIALIFLLSILLIVSFSWHKPKLYIAEVGQNGQVLNVNLLTEQYQPTKAQEEYFIWQFITLIRSIPLDPVAAHDNWLKAYNFLNDRGAQVLNDFFQKNSPLTALNKKTTVTLTINDINAITNNSYHVDWTEQSINQSGQIVGEQAMSGIFTIVFTTPKNAQEMLVNPLGIKIVDFHIAPKLT